MSKVESGGGMEELKRVWRRKVCREGRGVGEESV